MSLVIQSGKLTRQELVQVLQEHSCKFSFLIASNWREIYFDRFDPNHHAISSSNRGRAFGDKAELRWRSDDEGRKLLCLWISDDDDNTHLVGDAWKMLPELSILNDTKANRYLLWGEPLPIEGDLFWYQARIPRRLAYPVDDALADEYKESNDKTPLVLYVREYESEGRTMFDRFVKIEKYVLPSIQGSEVKS